MPCKCQTAGLNCKQGRACPLTLHRGGMAAEACTEVGHDERDEYDDFALMRGLLSALGITGAIAAVVLLVSHLTH